MAKYRNWGITAAIVALLALVVRGDLVIIGGGLSDYVPGTAPSSTLNTDLVAYWNLDETSGTRFDSEPTGTPQDLTDNNTVGYTNGIIGNAANFIASNSEYLSRSSAEDIEGGQRDWSVSLWVNDSGIGSIGCIINHGASRSAPDVDYYINFSGAYSARVVQFRVVRNSDVSAVTIQTGIVPTNAFIHLVALYSTVSNTTTLYTNGVIAGSLAVTGGAKDNTTETFRVGYTALSDNPFTGFIDEMGFWSKTLTQDEITELYNSGAGKTCCPF